MGKEQNSSVHPYNFSESTGTCVYSTHLVEESQVFEEASQRLIHVGYAGKSDQATILTYHWKLHTQ